MIIGICDMQVGNIICNFIIAYIICDTRVADTNCNLRVANGIYDSSNKSILEQSILPLTPCKRKKQQFTQSQITSFPASKQNLHK
jgi:hypothetical protein